MVIIGISGNPGAGKTTVSQMIFSNSNTKVISLDKIFDVIKEKLPNFLITTTKRDSGEENMFLTRNKLYNSIKNNPTLHAEYLKLRTLLGKKILKRAVDRVKDEDYDFIVIEGVALFDYGDMIPYDFLIKVEAPYDVRSKRVNIRNSKEELENSNPMETFIQDYKANYHILNNASLEELHTKVSDIEEDIIRQLKTRK